jgi:excisionase family DNA binding protein
MSANRLPKRAIPPQDGHPKNLVSWIYRLPAAIAELRAQIIQLIGTIEGLQLLVVEVLDHLKSTKSSTEKEELVIPVDEAAELLRVCERTITRRIESGELTGMKEGGVLRVLRPSIDSYIERNIIISREDEDDTE